MILQQGGALPALRAAIGGISPAVLLRQLRTDNIEIERILRDADGDIAAETARVDNGDFDDEQLRVFDRALTADLIDYSDHASISNGTADALPNPSFSDSLRVLDVLDELSCGMDDEAAEYLVANRVSSLWDMYTNGEGNQVNNLLSGEGGRWFRDIRDRFVAERTAVEQLPIPEGYSFAVSGVPSPPNAMQRRAAWAVREKRRLGNWSGVGAGKTLSAVLASRVADARITLVITNKATVSGWSSPD